MTIKRARGPHQPTENEGGTEILTASDVLSITDNLSLAVERTEHRRWVSERHERLAHEPESATADDIGWLHHELAARWAVLRERAIDALERKLPTAGLP